MSADLVSRGFSTLLTWVAEPAARSLALGCFAAAALAILRVKRVSTRLGAWTAVLCLALAMPLLGFALPRVHLAVPSAWANAMELPALLRATAPENAVQVPAKEKREPAAMITERKSKFAGAAAQSAKGMSDRQYAKAAAGATGCADANFGCHSEALAFRSPDRFASNKDLSPKTPGEVRRFAQHDETESYASPLRKGAGGYDETARGGAVTPIAMPVMPFKPVPVGADDFAISTAQKIYAAILGIYLFVAVVLLARFFAGMLFSGKLERAAQEISPLYFAGAENERNREEREALRLLRFRSSIAGVKVAPLLKESAAIAVPATIGIRKPVILLPADWRAWGGAELDAILAHEVSHVARRDALIQQLSLIHRAIFWFSPLAWWLDRQLTELAEQASDEAALAGGADRTRYAETLLGFFAQLSASRRRVRWQGVSMASRAGANSAERRVERILAWKGSIASKKSLLLLLVVLAVPVVFVAASVHPVIAFGQDKTQSADKSLMPGGPKAPALPKAPMGGVVMPAPKGGVIAPALPPTPQGGVVASAALTAPAAAPAPGAEVSAQEVPAPVAVTSAAPSGGVASTIPAPMPNAPQAGVVAPALPSAPTGALATHAGPQAAAAPAAPTVWVSSAALSVAQQEPDRIHVGSGVGIGAGSGSSVGILHSDEQQDVAVQLRAAEKALDQADTASASARMRQIQSAMDDLQAALRSASESDSAQMLAAQHALEKAQRLASVTDAQRRREAEDAVEEARRDLREANLRVQEQQDKENNMIVINGGGGPGFYVFGDHPRYVIVTGPKNVSMSGDDEDLQHALHLHEKLGKDLIWFERDEKSYVITDPAFIAKAKALFAPEQELSKQQHALELQQEELERQQDALGEQREDVKVKIADITPELERIRARLKELQASGATQMELGRIQSEIGRLQSEVGRSQSVAGVSQSEIGRRQGEIGRKQGDLGRQQGELGRRQGEIARQASKQLRVMFDDAIQKGIAKPE